MIKIKIYELEKHRNETTFRPFLFNRNLFEDIGIKFVTEGEADFAFIAQASFINKKISLNDSIQYGANFLKTIKEPFFLFDGQDSATLMGSYEVFKNSNALFLLKNTLYKDINNYKKPFVNGRLYWGSQDENDYKIKEDINFKKVKLSYTNWLSTINPQWYNYNKNKKFDISAMFSPSQKDTFEHGLNQSIFYKKHRDNVFKNINSKYSITKVENGIKYNLEEYYNRMFDSKIVIAPFGFGEIAPRDLESAMFGCVLIKADMSHIDTEPNIFTPYETYIPCKHDYSDLNEKIDYVLSDYKNIQEKMIENFRKQFIKKFNPTNLIMYYYNLFKNIDGVIT